MKQWEKRVKLFELVYSALIRDISPNDLINFSFEQSYEFGADSLKILECLVKEWEQIVNLLKPNISTTWTWERISYTDKAILLLAVAENKALDTPRNVIIDQSLITAKNYSIDDSYKFINPILEKVLKNA